MEYGRGMILNGRWSMEDGRGRWKRDDGRWLMVNGRWISAEREELGGKSFRGHMVIHCKAQETEERRERDDEKWLMVNGRGRRVDVLRPSTPLGMTSFDCAQDRLSST